MNLHYVAGIIDGEGYVSIDRNSNIDRSLVGKTVVQMSGAAIPKLFLKQFGGNYRTYKRSNPNQCDAHTWSITGRPARKFLKRILPFLFLKKEQAKLVIALYDLKDKTPIKNHPPERIMKQQFQLYVKAKKLVTRKGAKTRKNYANYRLWASR